MKPGEKILAKTSEISLCSKNLIHQTKTFLWELDSWDTLSALEIYIFYYGVPKWGHFALVLYRY